MGKAVNVALLLLLSTMSFAEKADRQSRDTIIS